jgi:glycosyltransferase involved in cell wall biosynthesis
VKGYLSKRALPIPLILTKPCDDLSLVVVIPAFREDKLTEVLADLRDCDPSGGAVEIIVLINHASGADPDTIRRNVIAFRDAHQWALRYSTTRRAFHILIHGGLPPKKAGVGLARKIGMDEAVRRFLSVNIPDGIIVCLDADCRVEKGYLSSIERFFIDKPGIEGCSIAFEHPTEGIDLDLRTAIIDYELHLRYFIEMQRWAGLPYAFQTVGSAMAVRAEVYCKVGGMNKRQAGEDFYFLHKIIERGRFAELNTTKVIPSPRPSDRVPFGTGRAVGELLASDVRLHTYHPDLFGFVKTLVLIAPELYHATNNSLREEVLSTLKPTLVEFLRRQGLPERLEEIQQNTATLEAFVRRFYRWFNAFLLMKYLHYARGHGYPDIPVKEACITLFDLSHGEWDGERVASEMLSVLRIRSE